LVDPRKLEAFVVLVETKSFSETAARINLSQPTVSGHIKSLEEYFGLRLFDRSTREVNPTRAGLFLYEWARKILELYRQMEKEISDFKGVRTGRIEVGGSTIPGQYILPFILAEFQKEHPEISIFLKVGDTAQIINDLLNGKIEIGMVGAKDGPSNIAFKPIFPDEIILVGLPQNEPSSPLTLKELLDLPLIGREPGSGTWATVLKALKKHRISPEKLNIVVQMGSTEAVKQAIKAGLGYSFLSKRAVESELTKGELAEIPVEKLAIKRNFYLIHHKERELSPASRAFLAFCENKTQEEK